MTLSAAGNSSIASTKMVLMNINKDTVIEKGRRVFGCGTSHYRYHFLDEGSFYLLGISYYGKLIDQFQN